MCFEGFFGCQTEYTLVQAPDVFKTSLFLFIQRFSSNMLEHCGIHFILSENKSDFQL